MRKSKFVTFLVLIVSQYAVLQFAPIVRADPGFTFGAKSQVNSLTNNPILLSHTTVANTKLLVVGIMTKTTVARTGGAPTFNGVAMTQVGSTKVGSAECTAELWYLSNPSIGTYNVSVPNAGALTITVIASSYVDATVNSATLDVYNSTQTTVANPSLIVTTTTNGEAIVDVFGSGYASPATANSQTLLYKTDEGVWGSHAQYALQTTAGAITFSWTIASDDVAFIVAAFKGVSAGDTTPPTYSLNSTNSTLAGTAVEHRLNWTDNVGLSGFIFSFDNCTGTLVNDTWITMTGTGNWSNVTKVINLTVGCTIRWCVYANDTNNNWNGTSCQNPFSYTTTSAVDTAFSVAMPSSYIFTSINGTTEATANSTPSSISFNFTSIPQTDREPYAGPPFDGSNKQSSITQPIFWIRSDSTGTAINISLRYTGNIPSGITLYANCSCTGCTSCQTTKIALSNSYQQLITGLSSGSYGNVTMYADVASGTGAGESSVTLYTNSSV
jgi:hypothetical protein